jgi:hypothetical protein
VVVPPPSPDAAPAEAAHEDDAAPASATNGVVGLAAAAAGWLAPALTLAAVNLKALLIPAYARCCALFVLALAILEKGS